MGDPAQFPWIAANACYSVGLTKEVCKGSLRTSGVGTDTDVLSLAIDKGIA